MKIDYLNCIKVCLICLIFTFNFCQISKAQSTSKADWILPDDASSPAMWGIQDGIVFSLWPAGVEPNTSGPRGLIRIGHNFGGQTYQINFIAVEPVVDGEMEFSEISPSRVDGKIGKFMWAGDSEEPAQFRASAITRGNITHPHPGNPDIEQLSLYIFMEKFLNGAHPYLKVTIRSDRPQEIGLHLITKTANPWNDAHLRQPWVTIHEYACFTSKTE